jgi:uncharacterized protein YdhG (YjbR/CyaY superfamily)
MIATVQDYIQSLPEDRQSAITKLCSIVKKNLPKGFEECISYGMIGYSVPHSLYPKGYHCDPKIALPFLSIASQKNFIAIYHMGIYADPTLLNWFTQEYPKHSKGKLDMGKSCIRFKKADQIPFELIAELATKMTAKQWIELYEKNYVKPKTK